MEDLTETQRRIWQYIRSCTLERGYPPTLREIGDEFQIASTNGVRYHLRVLAKKGYLERPRGMRRGLQLTTPQGENPYQESAAPFPEAAASDPSEEKVLTLPMRGESVHLLALPILGRIAAGAPLLAEQNWEGEVLVDPEHFHNRRGDLLFGLKVKGDSMMGIGVLSGDVAVIRSQSEAKPGEIVAAMVDGEATIKRFRPRGNDIWLLPENLSYRPIRVESHQQFSILGVVTGIIRNQVF